MGIVDSLTVSERTDESSFKKNFALLGAAGYIAPRHLRAIRDCGCRLLFAVDPNDSVGILDSYFPSARFFLSFDAFRECVHEYCQSGGHLDYVSICTPNYLHCSQIVDSLRLGADVICEKPLVLDAVQLGVLSAAEQETCRKVNTILQLRLHPAMLALKKRLESVSGFIRADLTYITSRGPWYRESWKYDSFKGGGIASNIGIHFFDLLLWFFGDCTRNEICFQSGERLQGKLYFENAEVAYFLSIDANDLPQEARMKGQRTWRTFEVDDHKIEFSEGFTDLHTLSYQKILEGEGFGIQDAEKAVGLCAAIGKRMHTGEPL